MTVEIPPLTGKVSPSTADARLSYRIASKQDLPLLIQLREECGWGADTIAALLSDPNRVYCIFQLRIDGRLEDVGMACWVLEKEGDPETASRAHQSVFLASLFIRQPFQKRGLGAQAMDLLERAAGEEYGARWVTLDTAAFLVRYSDELGYWVEWMDKPNPTVAWYLKRGYSRYREDIPFIVAPTPADPMRKITTVFLRKPAGVPSWPGKNP